MVIGLLVGLSRMVLQVSSQIETGGFILGPTMLTQSRRIYQSRNGAASSDLYASLAEGFVAYSHYYNSSVPYLAFSKGLHLSLLMMKTARTS
jgi:hypothetical protein